MIIQRFDPSGEQYFRELPDRLARVVDRWLLELSQPYPIGIGELARKVGSFKLWRYSSGSRVRADRPGNEVSFPIT